MNNQQHPLDIRDQVMLGSYDITKDIISQHADQLLELIDNGHTDAISIAIQAKYLTEVLEATKERIRELVCDELHKYAKGEQCVKHGASFALKEAGVSYDYSGCGDLQWSDLDSQIKVLTEQRKEREKFLRGIKDSLTIVDESTGEIATLHAPIKRSTSTYSITWKK